MTLVRIDDSKLYMLNLLIRKRMKKQEKTQEESPIT